MAIKVNGTTVINDSRQLSNIASLDSTTAALIASQGGISSGTTANRPSSPSEGDVYYNTDLDTLEVYKYITTPGGYVTRSSDSGILYRSSLSHTPNSGSNTDAAYGFEFEGGEGARSTNGNAWRLTYVDTVGYSGGTYYYAGGTQTTINLPADGSFVSIGQSVAFTFSGVRSYTLEELTSSSTSLGWAGVPTLGQPTSGSTYTIAPIRQNTQLTLYNSFYASSGYSITNGGGDGYARTGYVLSPGTVTISGLLKVSNSSYPAYARVLVNGSQEAEVSHNTTTETTKSMTVSVKSGDSIDVQFKSTSYGQDVYIKNWSIKSGGPASGSVILV